MGDYPFSCQHLYGRIMYFARICCQGCSIRSAWLIYLYLYGNHKDSRSFRSSLN
ncbi:hypothetical protein Lalb_Chr09g0322421 [Lupinus albus]|uniref:Uncharacterized protein n=1 Tax=Lupinus albus TaxID=3870 RepID=A0A6A4PZ67_LUPAL|nr:hypothetical protein Lalb_Chr09g0322421 [Lupinus albus]